MIKQYMTRQRFEFEKYSAESGQWVKAGYLLMPDEVTEFHHYLNELEWSYDKAFERLTGKAISDDFNNRVYRDIVLVVETIQAI